MDFQFRKLLLLAMVTRVALIPVQIWTDPMWWQFVSDTLPEMVFASAWTVLATFFVQLVGIAMGTGTNTSPGLVISATVRFVSSPRRLQSYEVLIPFPARSICLW